VHSVVIRDVYPICWMCFVELLEVFWSCRMYFYVFISLLDMFMSYYMGFFRVVQYL
jgi:hypothetical protein